MGEERVSAQSVLQGRESLAFNGQELADAARPGVTLPGSMPGQMDVVGPAVDIQVAFASGSARLTPSATRTLDAIRPESLSRRLCIEGFTDSVGSPEANRDLAQRRAQAVATYLEQNLGVESHILVVRASMRLLVPTPRQTEQGLNRRAWVTELDR